MSVVTNWVPPLRRVEVEGLFGNEQPVRIEQRAGDEDLRRLILLYGENGSGKTTILELLFHALAPAQDQWHRNILTKFEFRRLTIDLNANARLIVTREMRGSQPHIDLLYERGKQRVAASFNKEIADSDDNDIELDEFYRVVAYNHQLNIHYVPESRRFAISRPGKEERFDLSPTAERRQRQGDESQSEVLQSARPVHHALERFNEWLRIRAFNLIQAGSITAHDVVRRALERVSSGDSESVGGTLDQSLSKIDRLISSFARFEPFGLAPVPELSSFAGILRDAPPVRRPVVLSVMEPYLETLDARLNLYSELYKLLTNLHEHLLRFFEGKQVSLSVVDGITIRTRRGEVLFPHQLSSGERQLLLMITTAVLADRNNSLFIIDEPEISLNIKWQRMLVRALLDCTQAQFVIASHSVEVLAPFSESIQRIGP